MTHRLRGLRRVAALVALVVALSAPQQLVGQKPQNQERRQALQQQIGERFMEHVTRQLQLDEPTKTKLEQHLRASGQERQQLARRAAQLRMQMMRAARDSATADAEFRRLLDEATQLRQKEEDIWRTDQQALARILTPRQQVQFVFMWLRFTDQIRELANRRPGGPGRPPAFRP